MLSDGHKQRHTGKKCQTPIDSDHNRERILDGFELAEALIDVVGARRLRTVDRSTISEIRKASYLLKQVDTSALRAGTSKGTQA